MIHIIQFKRCSPPKGAKSIDFEVFSPTILDSRQEAQEVVWPRKATMTTISLKMEMKITLTGLRILREQITTRHPSSTKAPKNLIVNRDLEAWEEGWEVLEDSVEGALKLAVWRIPVCLCQNKTNIKEPRVAQSTKTSSPASQSMTIRPMTFTLVVEAGKQEERARASRNHS